MPGNRASKPTPPFLAAPVLVLAPHTDDAELGCGGTIARLRESNLEVTVVAFSRCEQSLPPNSKPDRLEREFHAAMRSLRVDPRQARCLRFPVRRFGHHRQEILDTLVTYRSQLRPRTVFFPARDDVHQDHQVVATEALRAFRSVNLFGYELPWNSTAFTPTLYVPLSARHFQAKERALKKYISQRELRAYFQPAYLTAWARFRGLQSSAQFAEAFEVVKVIAHEGD